MVEKACLVEDVRELLDFAKKENTYWDLSKDLGLHQTSLRRYKEGYILPRSERMLELRKELIKKTLGVRKIISDLYLEWGNDHLVTWNLAGNTELLKMAAIETHEIYGIKK